MGYRSLKACVDDLEHHGHLIRINHEIDPNLEIAEIQRRVYAAGGPALLFEKVKGSPFPALANLFGTMDRCRFMFRDTIDHVKEIIAAKGDPMSVIKRPFRHMSLPFAALKALPKKSTSGPVAFGSTRVSALPQVKSWPDDGGPFITLPQVLTEDPDKAGVMNTNLGMYRVQLAGNDYIPDKEIGLHYQIHRGIGVHHSKALAKGEPLKVSIFVGGPPAHTFAAVMPLPEGMSELTFAGMLGGRRFRWYRHHGWIVSADADFCILGTIEPGNLKTEGPFGDHLGYYSLEHDYPVLKVEKVLHRKDAIWPFTVVGRPPQEDTTFGDMIHELTGPAVPAEIPGLHAMHAVDAAGVHPLLLAIGSERYVPYAQRKPQEILTIANAILGFGQASLAKYLLITAKEDDPELDIHDIEGIFKHVLERIDWRRDLHFQTLTTIDTLDYSGSGYNEGSKVVMAAAGEKKRDLADAVPEGLKLPEGFGKPAVVMPGILALEAPEFTDEAQALSEMERLSATLKASLDPDKFPLVILTDDSVFTSASLNNFLWITFTRSNPSHDIYGVDSFIRHKHWGCEGSLIIDARIKPHHAPPLIEDPAVSEKVDRLSAKGGPLHGII